MLHDMSIDSEQVKALRESRGWSQEQLAEVAGLSLRTIQRVEAEGKGARETKLSLAAAFDVPVGRLCLDESRHLSASSYINQSAITLFFTGTVLVIFGLIAQTDIGILLAAAAILISALSIYGLEQLNGMRRAAGMSALIKSDTAMAGASILIATISVILLSYAIAVPNWWVPAGILGTIGLLLMLWPFVISKILLVDNKV